MKEEYSQYAALAEFYDALNGEVDYVAWTDFLHRILMKYGVKKETLVLDLACGTGTVTQLLSEKGYNMIGVDASDEMLAKAASKYGSGDILWLCQDMRDFELYGTVGAAVCCLDSLNYLLKTEDLKKCFALVHNYLDPDGIFIFDMNTPNKFKNIYANNCYVLEGKNIFCTWQNCYNENSRICDFYLTMFSKASNGMYKRYDEVQRERCYSDKTVKKLLCECGFELLENGADFSMKKPSDIDERAFYVAKALK